MELPKVTGCHTWMYLSAIPDQKEAWPPLGLSLPPHTSARSIGTYSTLQTWHQLPVLAAHGIA